MPGRRSKKPARRKRARKAKVITLRYAENPQQKGELVLDPTGDDWSAERFTQVGGREMSYVNVTDRDRALTTMRYAVAALRRNAYGRRFHYVALGLKHGNCCGAAFGISGLNVIRNMLEGNRRDIFGGVVMLNMHVDEHVARQLVEYRMDGKRRVLDMVIAPSFDAKAVEVLDRREGRCKMFANPAITRLGELTLPQEPVVRPIHGGVLVQEPQPFVLNFGGQRPQRIGKPLSPDGKRNLAFAAALCATSNSNTITLVKGGMLIGQGIGQTSRVGAAKLAIANAREAGHDPTGAVACSDSFFPFPDGPKVLIEAGVRAVFATEGGLVPSQRAIRDAFRNSECTYYRLPDSKARMFANH